MSSRLRTVVLRKETKWNKRAGVAAVVAVVVVVVVVVILDW